MDLLGPSLWDVWNGAGQAMDNTYVACVAVEAIYILKELHQKGQDLHHTSTLKLKHSSHTSTTLPDLILVT